MDFNWIALATVLGLNDREAKGRTAGPAKAFCSENDKGVDQRGISAGDETWSASGHTLG